jgi:hypothetical protein
VHLINFGGSGQVIALKSATALILDRCKLVNNENVFLKYLTISILLNKIFFIILNHCITQKLEIMNVIHFNYSGLINGEENSGNAILQADSESGVIQGNASFSSLPDSFTPSLASWSFLSISCSNSSKRVDEANNILDFSNGEYTSRREVELFNSAGAFLGSVIINGVFTKVSDELYIADVIVSANYNGPVEINFPDGYLMPLNAIDDYKLEGSFEKELFTNESEAFLTKNKQTYYFNNGVKIPLSSIKCELVYNTDESYWLQDSKILHLIGESTVSPL